MTHTHAHTRLLSAATLSALMGFGAAAVAADLPKEGTFNVTFSSSGTFKGTAIGKERFLAATDDNGLTVGTGLFDHLTWHCFGLYEVAGGMAQWNGYCVATDPAGDQIAVNAASDGKYAADAKSSPVVGTLTTGTGKYAGISGGLKLGGHGPEFRTAADGSFVQYGTMQGSYKIP